MAELITLCGAIVQIDEEDREKLSGEKWRVDERGYVVVKAITGRKTLHRIVFGAEDGQVIDHIDGDKLNNQKSNLRVATVSQNQANSAKQKGCTSKHKGVHWVKKDRKWRAKIRVNNTVFSLGHFDNEDEAGHAYNKAAIQHFGEFARLNPIGEDKPAARR